MYIRKFLPLLLFIFFCTCGRAPDPTVEAASVAAEAREVSPPAESSTPPTTVAGTIVDVPYKIEDGALMGMKAGELLADFSAGLRAGVLRTGEGDFDVLYIDAAEGDELGYLMADESGETISDITVTSPLVVTEHGLTVGMTYADLQQQLGQFAVHGSEIEGQTHAQADGYWYRLDAGNWSYEVDPNTLQPETKILSIGLPQ